MNWLTRKETPSQVKFLAPRFVVFVARFYADLHLNLVCLLTLVLMFNWLENSFFDSSNSRLPQLVSDCSRR